MSAAAVSILLFTLFRKSYHDVLHRDSRGLDRGNVLKKTKLCTFSIHLPLVLKVDSNVEGFTVQGDHKVVTGALHGLDLLIAAMPICHFADCRLADLP